MNRAEVESVLFRFSVLYPAALRLTGHEHQARIEEWHDSDLKGVTLAEAQAAVSAWKRTQDWPPSLHEFLEACMAARARLRPALPPAPAEPEDPPLSGDEALENLARFRALCATATNRAPTDDRPTRRLSGGALVHAR